MQHELEGSSHPTSDITLWTRRGSNPLAHTSKVRAQASDYAVSFHGGLFCSAINRSRKSHHRANSTSPGAREAME